MSTVCDATLESVVASADGYARVSLKDRNYPGITINKDSMIDGVLYANLDQDALKRLDFYEGDEFVREVIKVELNNKKITEAYTYFISPKFQHILTNLPWNFKEYKDKHLSSDLKKIREIMRGYSR